MKKIILCLTIALLFAACTEKNGNTSTEKETESKHTTLRFKKEDFGAKWPFSVATIEVYCVGHNQLYFRANGEVYPLNGKAKSASRDDASISDEANIWLDDPKLPGVKIIFPRVFFEEGLLLCNE